MTKKKCLGLCVSLLLSFSAHAWEVGEFKSGMLRSEVDFSPTMR